MSQAISVVAIALRRRQPVPPGSLRVVDGDPLALLVKHAQVELSLRQTLVRRRPPPAGSLRRIAAHPLALHIDEAELLLRPGLALPGGAPGPAGRLGARPVDG